MLKFLKLYTYTWNVLPGTFFQISKYSTNVTKTLCRCKLQFTGTPQWRVDGNKYIDWKNFYHYSLAWTSHVCELHAVA